MNYRELARRIELNGLQETSSALREAFDEGHLSPDEFSLRDLAEHLIPDGREYVRSLDPRNGGEPFSEADGVDVTAFANITGQIVYTRIMQAFRDEAFILSRLIDTIPTRLDGEKIPGVAKVAETVFTRTYSQFSPERVFKRRSTGRQWRPPSRLIEPPARTISIWRGESLCVARIVAPAPLRRSARLRPGAT